MATIRYAGQRRRARILDFQTRGGETYAIALIDGFKIEKWVHSSSIIKQSAT